MRPRTHSPAHRLDGVRTRHAGRRGVSARGRCTRRATPGLGPILALAVLVIGSATPSAGSIEDFESWDIGATERDDEYGLDSFFLTYSPEWEGEWRFTEEGARASMGCTVNEVWEMRNEIRLRKELGPRGRFSYDFLQTEGLAVTNQQHSIGIEGEALGLWFGSFARPHAAKERLDVGLRVRRAWKSGYHAEISVSFEDLNSDHTNGRSSIVDRTSVDFRDPAREWRFSGRRRWADARWVAVDAALLPEFRRSVSPAPSTGDPDFLRTLRGNSVAVHAVADPLPGVVVEVRAERMLSRLADASEDVSAHATDLRRRSWIGRARVSHPLAGRWRGLWGVQARDEVERDAAGAADPYRLEMSGIAATAGVRGPLTSWLNLELGYGRQDTGVEQGGPHERWRFTHGTRVENRLYVILEVDLPGFRVRAIETIELDDEGYSAVRDHDKGFIQMQAVF